MVNKKRVLSLILAFVMLLGFIPFNALVSTAKAEELVDERPLTLRPKEVPLGENWTAGSNLNDEINRGSVKLRDRFRGNVINPLASDEAKIQVLSLMNSKAQSRSSVGAEGFKTYAFDNWQYTDSMIFWDGKIPTPDVIDAAHRNGVPIYGTLFFNWSSSSADMAVLTNFLREDSPGSGTFPEARKYVDIAKYYGFDGYFINQETTGSGIYGKGVKMRDFMIYAKKYAESVNYPIRFSWYDAMTNEGPRNHYNAVNGYNDYFVKPRGGVIPGDEFFINFNWTKYGNEGTAEHMKMIGRSPYDAYAGFELQQNSINTGIRWDELISSKDRKAIVSIGLFTPDSILGLSKDGEDYHVQERNFWTGYEGDPSLSKDRHGWRGMSRFVSDYSPVTSTPFKTFFNTGHGKAWFENGEMSRDYDWNARGVSEVLPTWRWWIQTTGTRLQAKYDYSDAYYGGNSIKFHGALNAENQINLYSTKLDATSSTKLSIITKGGENSTISVGVTTDEKYSNESFVYKNVEPSTDWKTTEIDLSQFAGQTIRAINIKVNGNVADYSLNIGGLSVYESSEKVAAPTNQKVKNHLLFDAKNSEAMIEFDSVEGADYYVVYADNGKGFEFIQASSSNIMYLPNIQRTESSQGTVQKLRIVAVGLNGTISEPAELDLDWKMEVEDTGNGIVIDSPNVVLGAEVIDRSAEESGEKAENALNGTITGNSDKWTVAGARSGYMDIRLTEERTIRRWRVEHAGHGGESVNDGLMNTRDFELQYRKDSNSPWVTAKRITNNKAHVTDVNLDEPITAQEFRLKINIADNGSPWGAIRIYNWMMFEQPLDLDATTVVPMSQVTADHIKNDEYKVVLRNVEENTKVELFSDREAKNLIAEQKTTAKGNVIFDNQKLEGESGLVYYRTTADGKEPSEILAVYYEKADEQEQPAGNKEALKALLDKAEALDRKLYNSESLKELDKAVKSGKAVYNKAGATDEEYAKEIEKLEKAFAALMINSMDVFYPGLEGSNFYRIPSIIKTEKDTVLAAADMRNQTIHDWNDIDIAVRRKEKGSAEFGDLIKILDLADKQQLKESAFAIDASMVESNGKIFMLVDMFPASTGLGQDDSINNETAGTGYFKKGDKNYLELTSTRGVKHYADENGDVYLQSNGAKTDYKVVLKSEKQPFSDLGDLYKGEQKIGNVYLKDAELKVKKTAYLWLLTSEDDGKTWSSPVDITPQVKADWMKFIGTGPGTGLKLANGRLVFPIYFSNQYSQMSAALVYSDDNGETWKRGESPNDGRVYGYQTLDSKTINGTAKQLTESQVIQLKNGDLKLFMRNVLDGNPKHILIATSRDNGETWDNTIVRNGYESNSWCQMSVISFERDGKEYVMTSQPIVPGTWNRYKGTVKLGEVNPADSSIDWIGEKVIDQGAFQYSVLVNLENDKFGVLYESGNDSITIKYKEFDVKELLEEKPEEETSNLAIRKSGNKYPVAIASWTNDGQESSDRLTAINDDIISYNNNPQNRWTNWSRARQTNDWVGYIFGDKVVKEETVDEINIAFYKDGSTNATKTISIEYYVGPDFTDPKTLSRVSEENHPFNDKANWKSVENLKYENQGSEILAGKETSFTFDPVTTKAIRVNLERKDGNFGVGITEMQVFGNAEEAVNKDKLKAAIEKAEGLDLANKTEETAKSLNEALESGKLVFKDEEAKQDQVDKAEKAILDAIANLKDKEEQQPGTCEIVQEALTESNIYKTPRFWVDYNQTQTRESALVDGDESTIVWYGADGNAYQKGDYVGLDLKEVKRLDKFTFVSGGLKSHENEFSGPAGDYFKSYVVKYSEDGSTWKTFGDEITQSKPVQKNVIDFSKEEINARYVIVESTVNEKKWVRFSEMSISTLKCAEEPDKADKTALIERVDEITKELPQLNKDKTKETLDALQQKLNEAKEVIKDKDATEEKVAEALAALNKAYDALENKEPIPEIENPFGDKKARIVSVDAGRKYFSVEQLKQIIDEISKANYTHLHLLLGNDGMRFLLDDMSITTSKGKYSSEDVKAGITKGNQKYGDSKRITTNASTSLTQAEMDQIFEYAKEKNIKIIPSINSPGHMDAILVAMEELGIQNPYAYNGSRKSVTTLDIEREDVKEFTKEFVQLYIDYFASKGAEIFNFGADEYANDAFQNPGWSHLVQTGKYDKFIEYANDLSERILRAGMRPMAFNDGFYYGSKTNADFNKQIIIALWTAGWSGFDVAPSKLFIEKGHDVLNVNDSWYYVMGRENSYDGWYHRQMALEGIRNKAFDVNVGDQIETIGSMVAMWADEPRREFELDKFVDWINAFANRNPEQFTKEVEEEVNKEKLKDYVDLVDDLLPSLEDLITNESL
ncbi:endo-beta-N-acetylglucosaminidase, partial [Helcococcus sueciensis]|uniref:endo-beta-N-acetylglucosaminidase n=1 Tax=Helcococcus sueciensis TaxID=241555 RepID=UPI0012EC0CD1